MKQTVITLAVLATAFNASAQTETTAATASQDSLTLDSIVRTLPEYVVKARRPVVKAEPGKLVFDMNALLKDRPADNAYDALKELPGVVENQGTLTLNMQKVNIILDGKVSSMTSEQLQELLKSIPKSRLAKCEVMMSAPARYHVRGAAINIMLRHGAGLSGVQGELYGAYRQKHYEGFEERATLLYNSSKFEMDVLYSHNHGRGLDERESSYLHSLNDGTSHQLDQYTATRGRSHRHNMRLGMNWNFTKDNTLSLVYTGNYKTTHARQVVSGSVNSTNRKDDEPWLHNLQIDWQTPWGMSAGVEMTYYKSPSTELLNSRLNGEQLNFLTDNSQKINRWQAYLSQEHTLGSGWGLNYGVTAKTSVDNSWQRYIVQDANTATLPSNTSSRQRETTVNMYAGATKTFGQKLSLDVSLAAEYYNSPAWNQWDFFPNVNLTYMPAQGHMLIFSLDCDKVYPSYWAVKDFTSYSDGGYGLVVGNPQLKPSCDYTASLTYVLHNKYMLTAFFSYVKDYFAQLGYQRPDTLITEYKNLNAMFQQQAGLQLTAPFSLGQWLNSRLTLTGLYQKERNTQFYDIPYSRGRFSYQSTLSNTFTLSKALTLTLDGTIHGKFIQGPYDIKPAGALNAALQLKLLKDKLLLKAWCNDVFESNKARFTDTWKGQNISVDMHAYREFGVSLTYKFNDYKERKREAVDTSRFK